MANAKDLSGQRFGSLIVLGDSGERRNRFVVWECQCDCGNKTLVVGTSLTRGHTKSCGCLRKERQQPVDLTNRRFGRLIAVRSTEERKNTSVVWECRCDCGKTAFVRSSSLLRGATRSCGCLQQQECTADLSGRRFGKLVAIKQTEERKNKYVVWECRCDCGNTVFLRSNSLLQGQTKSCGCMRSASRQKIIDLTGTRFGRLTVIRDSGERRNFQIVWECICDCGEVTKVVGYSLIRGYTKSCGCLRRETTARVNEKDLRGCRFGNLVALRKLEDRQNDTIIWECRCDCGAIVNVLRSNLTSGNTKSCGCKFADRIGRDEIVI